MDDAQKAPVQHKATKVSKTVEPQSHKEIVKLVQANHARTMSVVRDRQNSVLFKDSGC